MTPSTTSARAHGVAVRTGPGRVDAARMGPVCGARGIGPDGTRGIGPDGTRGIGPDGTRGIGPDGTRGIGPLGTRCIGPDGTRPIGPDGDWRGVGNVTCGPDQSGWASAPPRYRVVPATMDSLRGWFRFPPLHGAC